jgi:hypothetical protein
MEVMVIVEDDFHCQSVAGELAKIGMVITEILPAVGAVTGSIMPPLTLSDLKKVNGVLDAEETVISTTNHKYGCCG